MLAQVIELRLTEKWSEHVLVIRRRRTRLLGTADSRPRPSNCNVNPRMKCSVARLIHNCPRAVALAGTYSFLTNFIGKGGVTFLRQCNFPKEIRCGTGGRNTSCAFATAARTRLVATNLGSLNRLLGPRKTRWSPRLRLNLLSGHAVFGMETRPPFHFHKGIGDDGVIAAMFFGHDGQVPFDSVHLNFDAVLC